jgi:HD-GYP domain-containing protein (c-di-GMP phosphodiesterase class II)
MISDVLPVHELIEVIIKIMDTRDHYTIEHSWRVAGMCEVISGILALEPDYTRIIHIAAHLHDIGKIGIADSVLNKAGRLTDGEYELMKTHSRMGYDILNKTEIFKPLSSYILHHHESWNGKGYPDGLSGRAIPLGSRIIAIADSFDAMTSSRPYKKALSYEEGFREILRCRGEQFCPYITDAFLDNRNRVIQEIRKADQEIRRYKIQQMIDMEEISLDSPGS